MTWENLALQCAPCTMTVCN